MNSEFKNIGLVIKPDLDEYKNVVHSLIAWLDRRNRKVFLLDNEQKRFNKKISKSPKDLKFVSKKDFYKSSDLIISLGGDGTLLSVCRNATKNNFILGVNLGYLGFITEYSKLDFYDALEKIIKGKFQSYKKPLFKVELILENKKVAKHHFINDIVVGKRDIARLVKLSVETEEDHIADISGDGIIISSPTGSTAYSLAAGGPILHPDVKAMVINPICAHGLNHRPLVVPDQTQITIKTRADSAQTNLTIDGQINYELDKKHIVHISRYGNNYVNIIKNIDRNFFLTLKEKLTHGKR